ncbi:MAG: DUF4476 domain-containing protein [Myxococcaceae bacterium]
MHCPGLVVVFAIAVSFSATSAPDALRVLDTTRMTERLRRLDESLSALHERLSLSSAKPQDLALLEDARAELAAVLGQLENASEVSAWVKSKTQDAPDAGHVPRAESTAGTSNEVSQQPIGPPLPKPPGKREVVGEVEMRSLVVAIQDQSLRGDKVRVIARAAPGKAFSTEQIIALLEELRAPEDRLETLRLLVPGLLDRSNVPVLYRACRNEAERNQVALALTANRKD